MLRAPVRRALVAVALIPLSAWAADQGQNPAQQPGQQPGQQPAEKTELFVTAGLGETDNVGLTATGTQAQTLASVGVLVDVERQGQLEGTLTGGVSYIDYLEHAFPGQVVGRLDGKGSYALIPDHFKWVVQETYGTAQVDALAPQDRNNIERVNVFATGPDFLMRPSEETYLRLGARYELVNYETSPFNSHRTLAMASIGDDLSVASSISLNADITQIRYQNTSINPDYDRRKFYLHYDTRGSRTSIALDVGSAQVDDTGPWNSKLLAQLRLTRDLTPFQSVYITGGQQFTDSADSFGSLTSGAAGKVIVAGATGTAGNYLDDYAAAGWRFKEDRTSLDVSARWDRAAYTIEATPAQLQDYILLGLPVGLNGTRDGLEMTLRRDLTPIVSAFISAAYAHESYETLGFIDHSVLLGIGVSFTPSSRLQYRVRFDHDVRTTDTVPALVVSQGLGYGYTENRIFLTAVYRLSE
jgi:hypothetical protein